MDEEIQVMKLVIEKSLRYNTVDATIAYLSRQRGVCIATASPVHQDGVVDDVAPLPQRGTRVVAAS